MQSITYRSFQRKTYFPLFLYFFWKTVVSVKITMYFYLYECNISLLFFLFLHKKRLFLWKNDTPFSIGENILLDVIDKYIKIFTFNVVTTFVKLRFTKVSLIFNRKNDSFLFCLRVRFHCSVWNAHWNWRNAAVQTQILVECPENSVSNASYFAEKTHSVRFNTHFSVLEKLENKRKRIKLLEIVFSV